MLSQDVNEPDYDPRRNPYKIHKGVKRVCMAACHSVDGFMFALREESAFRQELFLAGMMLPWAFVLNFTPLERVVLIATVLLVLIIELLNSGIEAAIDRISFNHHSLSKRAKDYGSAAVLVALILCGTTWIVLFYPHITSFLTS